MKKVDKLAEERTQLANERTMLAYVRTGLTIIISGFLILKFFEGIFMRCLAYISIIVGISLLSATLFFYPQRKKKIRAILED